MVRFGPRQAVVDHTPVDGQIVRRETMPAIILNGQEREVATQTTVADLLGELGLLGRPVAVERNRQVVERTRYDTTDLSEGDRVEVVSFVPGG